MFFIVCMFLGSMIWVIYSQEYLILLNLFYTSGQINQLLGVLVIVIHLGLIAELIIFYTVLHTFCFRKLFYNFFTTPTKVRGGHYVFSIP